MTQPLFDNKDFFEKYKAVRHKEDGYNNLIEHPAMHALLPDLSGKAVLDMGCGFGYNCKSFADAGATSVVGIDISQKMVYAARELNAAPNLRFELLYMEEIHALGQKFDVIFSSMAMHYIADFDFLVKQVYGALNDGGVFLFSQEHPMQTGGGSKWLSEEGDREGAIVSDYLRDGVRNEVWMEKERQIYHRSVSTIVNTLVENGFAISKIVEPAPSENALAIAPKYYKEFHRPTALIVVAVKS